MLSPLLPPKLAASAFTASDVPDLYLHRGSFETVLADEDDEQDSDRWYSHTSCGQEFAQILAQWAWNLRLELGQQLSLTELRTTEFAPGRSAEAPSTNEPEPAKALMPAVIYGPPQWARGSFTHGFPGSAFTGASRWHAPLSCQSPTLSPGTASRTRWLTTGLVCRTHRPLSFLPLAPVLWKDWPRCSIRRAWLKVVRSQTVRLESSIPADPSPAPVQISSTLTRAKRAHWRLSWEERFARNARPSDASRLVVTLHGLSATFARAFGFDLLATA